MDDSDRAQALALALHDRMGALDPDTLTLWRDAACQVSARAASRADTSGQPGQVCLTRVLVALHRLVTGTHDPAQGVIARASDTDLDDYLDSKTPTVAAHMPVYLPALLAARDQTVPS
ncbi:hypothetical protein [Dietzia sp. 179-F 9C3 NHS]|uniref:hypothetical protein n=1 Tax=Dietzia sp. 179-F 9C3 NHS TaxID=3374295 RepID=UPI00387A32FE